MDELNPRQLEFIKNYVDPKSETFGSAYASAIKAGFSESYASIITTRDCKWMEKAQTRRVKLVDMAEDNLETLLDSADERVQADMTKFTLTRLKKDLYSERVENTGKDGGPIEVKGAVTDEEFDALMASYGKRKEDSGSEEAV